MLGVQDRREFDGSDTGRRQHRREWHCQQARLWRQRHKDNMLLVHLLLLHITLIVLSHEFAREWSQSLGNVWSGYVMLQWLLFWRLKCWIVRQPWWQVR